MASVCGTAEHESTAMEIIDLLVETGDEWRKVTWEEFDRRYMNWIWEKLTKQTKWWYSKETKLKIEEDRAQARLDYYYNMEFFNDVAKWTTCAISAMEFSSCWGREYYKELR